jgi:hypothetical protein
MVFVLHFRARPIRRPVAIVAVTQRQLNAALWSWLKGLRFSRPAELPDNLRRDVGLEPLPPRDRPGIPYTRWSP